VLGRTDEAMGFYDRIVQLAPDRIGALREKAGLMTSLGKYDKAIELYDEAIELASDDAGIQRDRALALRLNGQSDAALAAYNRLLDLDDGDAETWGGKADLLIELERFPEAVECLNSAAAASGGEFEASDWTNRGYSMAAADAVDEAIYCFDQAIEVDNGDVGAFLGKAAALEAKGDAEAAMACYDQAIRLRDDDAEPWFRKGDILLNSRRHQEALDCYNAGLELDPDDAVCWINKAYCLLELKRSQDALAAFEKAIEIDSDSPDAWEGKGNCLLDSRRLRDAMKAYERALKLDPDLLWTNNNLGLVHMTLGEYERALQYFDRAIEIDGDEPTPIANKGQCLAGIGRAEEARSWLEEALDRVEERSPILDALAAVLADFLDKKQSALDRYEEAARLDPDNAEREVAMAEVLIRLNQWESAREHISRSDQTDLDSESRCVAKFLWYASCALEGRSDGTRQAFREFLDFICTTAEENENRPPVISWNYDPFVREIAHRSMDIETEFVLLIAIDLQLGRLAAPSLKQLSPELPLASPSRTDSDSNWEGSILGSIGKWLRKLVQD
jgi:tetratricopeptide (TPR) repeat protein